MFELPKVRITKIMIKEGLCWKILEGPEDFVRISRSANFYEFKLDRVEFRPF